MHQSCSVKGNDLNHLVEGNQAGLFCSIVFERITRPYTPRGGTLIFSYIRRLGPFFLGQIFEFQYFLGFSEK